MGKHFAELKDDESHSQGGCVTKHEMQLKQDDLCSYRGQGYKYMSTAKKALYHIDFTNRANAKRLPLKLRLESDLSLQAEYKLGHKKKPSNLRTPENPISDKSAWHFGVNHNYEIAYLPFNHNYHHIMPATSLHSLNGDELRLLQKAKYNLNGQENMIILPCTLAYAIAMQLPDHPHGHPRYNQAIKQIINKLKGKTEESRRTHEITEDNVGSYKQKLLDWQEDQFETIVDYGKSLSTNSVKNNIDRVPIAGPRAS
jgi:hypothetical protein